jgi:hypothetical protein
VRWFRRRRAGRHSADATHRLVTSPGLAVAAVPAPAILPGPAEPPVSLPPATAPGGALAGPGGAGPSTPEVVLGFADGSRFTFAADSDHARGFADIAAELARRDH